MGNRRHIPKAQKDLIVRMAVDLKPCDIAQVSVSAIGRVLQLWQTTGVTIRTPLLGGRPRESSSLDLVVRIIIWQAYQALISISFSI